VEENTQQFRYNSREKAAQKEFKTGDRNCQWSLLKFVKSDSFRKGRQL